MKFQILVICLLLLLLLLLLSFSRTLQTDKCGARQQTTVALD